MVVVCSETSTCTLGMLDRQSDFLYPDFSKRERNTYCALLPILLEILTFDKVCKGVVARIHVALE